MTLRECDGAARSCPSSPGNRHHLHYHHHHYMPQPLHPSSDSDRLAGLFSFLSGSLVSSLFQYHPNDAGTSSFLPPLDWSDWWDWAGADQTHGHGGDIRADSWYSLLQYYDWCRITPESGMDEQPPDVAATIPRTLRTLIENASRLALLRELGTVVSPCSGTESRSSPQEAVAMLRPSASGGSSTPVVGMSPKKAHEVAQMSDFIGNMLHSDPSLSSIEHVVDVGAGQVCYSSTLSSRAPVLCNEYPFFIIDRVLTSP